MKIKSIALISFLMIITFVFTYTISKNIANVSKVKRAKQNIVTHEVVPIPKPIKILEFDDYENSVSRDELLDPFLDTIDLINKEKLPFDEPKKEFGQQDGSLRPKWKDAYFLKKFKYEFNGDTYYVFRRYDDTKKLYPLVPQVCSDYLVDSIERSLGNWYYASSRKPHRIKGDFSIRQDSKKMGLHIRRLRELVQYMKSRPEYFEFVFEGSGLSIGNEKLLNVWLTKVVGATIGDIVIVHGRTPWDRREEHSHSFIITRMEDEFIAGISGNAGYAREWALGVESKRSPQRTVRYIIRLTDELLKKMQ